MVSKQFRVVDDETRVEVRNKRLAALEADNYGDDPEALLVGQDDDAYQDSDEEGGGGGWGGTAALKKKKQKLKMAAKAAASVLPGGAKRSARKVRSLDRVIMEQGYQYHLGPAAGSAGKKRKSLGDDRCDHRLLPPLSVGLSFHIH